MPQHPYKIYNASAGSGKTYTLVKEYLRILFTSKGNKTYKSILAITFTNKAVNEMKERILKSLYQFGELTHFNEAPVMFTDLSQELGIPPIELQKKSKQLLKEILHNYSFFDISTIDKFTHRLIRTFAKDLKLPQNFEIILDTDLLLGEAIDQLVSKAGEDEQLTKVLVDFALEKIDDDKSWDITLDLQKIGKLLFDENHAQHLQQLKNKSLGDFNTLKTSLKNKLKELETQAFSLAEKVINLLAENDLGKQDFSRGTLYAHFDKIKNKTFDYTSLYNNQLEKNLTEGKVYTKALEQAKKDTIDQLLPSLLGYYLEIKHTVAYGALIKNIYQNIVPLTVLNAINKEIKQIEVDRDQLHISSFNAIISNEIKNQPAPFIYERLGEKYKHYFIDEFQDTSALQWENLIPLISNALESEGLQGERGSLFLVGDTKQAIYRWRGGKAEQFLALTNQSNSPFVIAPEVALLPKNYRSLKEIVHFNNAFFTYCAKFFTMPSYEALFVEGNKQETNANTDGYVQISFIEKSNKEEEEAAYAEEVLLTIQSILEKQYKYQDICILVRNNAYGVAIANYLTLQSIPIISADSLLLQNNDKVRFLVHLLQLYNQPEELAFAYDILYFLSAESKDKHRFIAPHLKEVASFLQQHYGFSLEHIAQSSVYDALEFAIKAFNLAAEEDAYLSYFMDVVLDVEQKEGIGVPAFLTYWEKKKDALSIPAPESIDAVKLMTIHKSKGLEFPFVIFPYADAHIYNDRDTKLWYTLPESLGGFNEVLLNKKKEMEYYNNDTALLFNQEQQKLELDAFNVLYVALTRAAKGLFIISKKDVTTKGDHKTDYYSGLFIDYLTHINEYSADQSIYSFGNFITNTQLSESTKQTNIPYVTTHKEREGFKLMTTGGMLWNTHRENAINKGNLIHDIMGHIVTEHDIEVICKQYVQQGDIAEEELNTVLQQLRALVTHPNLLPYYKEGLHIKNETSIITKEGSILRPDRLVFQENKATIIDYKTGKSNPQYTEQLYAYADALEEVGYTIDKKILIYINEDITPILV